MVDPQAVWSFVRTLIVCTLAASCSAPEPEPVVSLQQDVWSNGDFESDGVGAAPPTGWSVTTYQSSGISGTATAPPASFSALNLSASAGTGKAETFVVGGATNSQPDPDLGAGQSFRYPVFGARAVRVNFKDATDSGKNKNANSLQQTMTVSAADVDPTDGQVHVRFAVAPILENPSHGYTQQPYYYVELTNLTRGTSIYHDFNVAGQSGVPWNTTTSVVTGNATQWLNWQLVDIAPGPAAIATGDQVKLTVVGSGCSLGGHFGRIYLDGIGPTVPGLYTWASGAQTAAAGANLTYTLFYANGGTTAGIGAHVDLVTPPQTTFVSASPGASCTAPAVGAAGTVSCPLGTLGAGASGSFTVTVKIAAGATGSIVNGNYAIGAVNAATLLGAKVTTTIPSSTATFADVSVSQTASRAVAGFGQAIQYTFKVGNAGPTAISGGLTVTDTMPPQLTGVTWTCSRTVGGGSTRCGTGSGSGNISVRPRIGIGGELQYVVSGTIASGSGLGSITHTVTASTTTTTDPSTANNTSVLTLPIGTARTLSLTKSGATGNGTVSSSPGGLSCGSSCASATGTFADSASVILTATPIGGASFRAWTGACTGSARTCTVTMNGDQSVTATFDPAPAVGPAAVVYAYAGTNQLARTSTAFAAPIAALVTDASGNALSGVTVTFAGPGSGAGAGFSSVTTTNAAGIATATATANASAGSYAVTAAVPSVATPASFDLINVGPAARLTYLTGGNASDPQQAPLNAGFPSKLMATVTDAAGNPVPGATVSFAAPASGATAALSAASATSDSSGVVQVGATANGVAGSYAVTATLSGAPPVTFSLQNLSSGPAAVFVIGGASQSTDLSTAFGAPLAVVVADALGNAVPGATVTFAAPPSGASATLSATTVTTDGTGQASVTATANASAGTYSVSAAASGATPATFTLVNNGTQFIDVQSGSPQHATVGAAFGAPLVAVVTDVNGAAVAGVTVTFTTPATGAKATLSSATAVTSAAGLATVSATAGTVAGSYTVTASTPLAGGLASFALGNDAGAATALAAVSGGGQTASAGAAFAAPLVARVADSRGNPVAGVTVSFAVPASGATASLDSATAVTDGDGLARVSPTAGATAGSYAVTASVSGIAGTASFGLTNQAGAATAIAALSGTPQSTSIGTVFAPLVARVTDAGGNPVAGVTVAFAAPSSGASATVAATATTNAAGLASATPTANSVPGDYAISATVSGVSGSADFALTNLAASPVAGIAVDSGTPQSATVSTAFAPIVAKVIDGNGSGVAGVVVTFTAPGAGASATVDATATTDAAGLASVTPTANSVPGTYTISATVTDLPGSADFELTNAAPSAVLSIAVSDGTPQATTVGTAFAPIVARITDGDGSPVSGVTVSFTAPAAGATATMAATDTTDADGLARVTPTAGTVAGSYVVSATASGVTGQADFALTNEPGAPALIEMAGGSPQRARVTEPFGLPLVAHVTDIHGNDLADVTVAFAAPPSGAGATLSAATAVTGPTGLAEVTATAGSVTGDYDVTASITGAATTFALTNLPGAATTIAVLDGAPQTATVGHAFSDPLRAVVKDGEGNLVPGATVTFTAPGSAATAVLDATSGDTDGDGVAAITASANLVAGSYDVTARLSTGASATFRLENKADAPFSITAAASATPQQMTVLLPYAEPLAVTVLDRHRNPVPDAVVSYTAPTSGPSVGLSAGTALTDATGVASVDATANERAGAFIVRAAVEGVTDPAAFALGNIAGSPRTLAIAGGDDQRVIVDRPLAALQVRVVDASGNPVPSVVVAFSAPADGATAVLAASSAQTDEAGVATLAARTGTVAGGYAVKATLVGGASPVSFALTNLPGAAATITAGLGSTPQNARVDHPFAHALVAQVVDAFTNPVPGVTVTFAATATPATGTLASLTEVTGDDGRVSTTITAGPLAGAYTVTASAPDVTTPARFALANLAGDAHAITAYSGMGQAAVVGAAFAHPIAALVEDANGNPVPGVTVVFTPPTDGPTAIPTDASATTDGDGIARTALTCGHQAGDFAIHASTEGAAAPAELGLTARPGSPAAATVLASASPQAIEVGHAFLHPLALAIADTYGNPVPGVRVAFVTPRGPGAQLSAAAATSDADGLASVLAIADSTAGAYHVTASVAAGPAADFALANTAAPPAAVVITGGGAQRTLATTDFPAPVTAHVVDAYGNPIAGVPVAFHAPTTGATATMADPAPVSDARGDVSVALAAGPVVGRFVLSAEVAGADAPATTTLEVTAIPTTITVRAPDRVAVNEGADVTITVAAAVGTPDGMVEVIDGDGARLGSAVLDHGTATIAVRELTVGSHAVSARYAAQGSYGASVSTAASFEATGDTGSISGAGCNATGGPGSLALVALAALLVARRRRAGPIAVALVALVRIAGADPSGHAISRFHAAAPDSAWFALDSATFAGERDVAIALVSDYAREPLDIYDGDAVRARVVRDALVTQLGASVTLLERLRLSAGAAMATWQHGSPSTYNGVRLPAPTYAFGDVTLAGDVRVVGAPGAALRVAVGFRLAMPSGQRTSYMSDAALAGEPRVLVAGTRGRLEYAGSASAFLRRETMFAGLTFGSELRYGAALGARLLGGALLVGPELFGATSIAGHAAVGTPLEAQLGGHYAAGAHVQLGVGAGLGVVNAVGEPHWRALVSLDWTP